MRTTDQGGGSLRALGFNATTLFLFASLALPFGSQAGGVVATCDEASLRAAMSGGGLVTFACDGRIVLTNTLVVETDTIFDATGREVTLDGNVSNRVFEVPAGVACSMTGLRIVNGFHAVEGAGVLNSGVLTLQRCFFSNNVAAAVNSGTRGGAILNAGTLNAAECTFIANQAQALMGGVSLGGAVRNGGTLRVNGCTFVQNNAVSGSGGAISTIASAAGGAGVTNCTFYRNTALYGGTALYTEGSVGPGPYIYVVNCTFAQQGLAAIQSTSQGATWVANCVVAGGSVVATDGGNNIFGTTIDARLGPLANNGGPTLTMEPLADSPAIDQGNNLVCPPTDQRGVARPIRARCDIGAVETAASPAPPVIQFAAAAASVNEGATNATIDVVRLGNSGPTVMVDYVTANGTAMAGSDYGFTSGTLTFGFGQTNATITVPMLNDQSPESAETVQLTLSAPSAGASLGTPTTLTLTIQDDDPAQPGTLCFQEGGYSAGEGGLDAIITVIRTGGTNGAVTVDFATSDGTAVAGQDYTPAQGTLILGDTEVRKSFVVSIVTDAVSESLETFSVRLSNPGGGAVLGNPSVATVSVTDGTRTVAACDEASLRAAVTAGGRVTLACDGTIYLTSPLDVAHAVFLDGAGHAVTISGSNAVRLFNINPGAQLRLSGLTLADGFALGTNAAPGLEGGPGRGGAVLNTRGFVVAVDCFLIHNRALGGKGGAGDTNNSPLGPRFGAGKGGSGWGGAIYNEQGSVSLTNVSFYGNVAQGGTGGKAPPPWPGPVSFPGDGGDSSGGALCSDNGAALLVGCSFTANLTPPGRYGESGTRHRPSGSSSGGAVYMTGGEVSIFRSRFQDQLCGGGGILSGASGGAIFQSGGTLALTDCGFMANQALGNPAAIQGSGYAYPGGNATGGALHLSTGAAAVTNCVFTGNRAVGGAQPAGYSPAGSSYGGAIYSAGQLQMVNSTLAANSAEGGSPLLCGWPVGSGYGGAVFIARGAALFNHLTIARNTAEKGLGCSTTGEALGGGVCSSNGVVTIQNSLLAYSPSGSNWFGATLVDEGNNISSDASCPFTAPGSLSNTDPLLAPLDDYGGPTPTMALLAGSPALNAARPAWCPPTDQRGVARPYGAACDIGAFESAPPYSIRGGIAGYLASPGGNTVTSGIRSAPVDPVTGRYVLWNFDAGIYQVTPRASQAVFEPNDRVVSVSADVVGVNFQAWRSNALAIAHVNGPVYRNVFAGAAGDTWNLMRSTNLVQWQFEAAHTVEPTGLFDFRVTNAPGMPPTFFRTEKP